jgi:predicted ATPase
VPAQRIVISGCSGGGKSTLIEGLALRGFRTVAEAGRIIIREQMKTDGRALPWIDPALFAEKLATLAIDQYASVADCNRITFFDRCIVEPVAYCLRMGVELPASTKDAADACRYDNPIFMVPPWESIFVEDTERQHSFDEAVAEYDALLKAFETFEYKVCVIPKMKPADRVDFILNEIDVQLP